MFWLFILFTGLEKMSDGLQGYKINIFKIKKPSLNGASNMDILKILLLIKRSESILENDNMSMVVQDPTCDEK